MTTPRPLQHTRSHTSHPSPAQRVVIVGGGHAAGSTAVALRDHGHEGPVLVLGAEPHVPYERPALSKGYLGGTEDATALRVVPASWYRDHGVELRLSCPVTAIDRKARTVHTADGTEEAYDHLVLATGAHPRHLPVADALADDGVPVCYLRTLDDADRLREHLRPGARVVVVGGGFLGLEVAATARTLGTEVALLETQPVPLAGVLGEEVGRRFAEAHRAHGVDLRLGARTTGLHAVDGRVVVELAEGSDVVGDVLVVGIGAAPSTELAAAAGLDVDDGVVADAHLRTSDPRVLAVGDLARFHHAGLGRSLRIEHWANAKAHGATAARTILGDAGAGAGEPGHTDLPYFFTDQYDLGMEYFGHVGPEGVDEVVVHEGDATSAFTAFYVQGGVVRAAMHVNDWDRSDELRSVVASRAPAEQVRQPA